MRRVHRLILWSFAVLAAGLLGERAAAAPQAPTARSIEDLQSLSIEDLARIEVTSVAKRPQALSDAAAAIYVITAEDIRRSGATSLPEALRLAPNLEVARLNAYSYAITARGMNSAESSNKLLVLIDGRSVYEPIGSGVLWQQVDVPLASIERIEVISGPGGVLWGANAVNGVINIISKSAHDTQGAFMEGVSGDRERDLTIRYGGALGEAADYRLTLMGFDRDGLPRYPHDFTQDGFRGARGSLQIDGRTEDGGYQISAAAYRNHIVTIGSNFAGAPSATGGGDFSGGDLQGRLSWQGADGSNFEVQAYFARDDRTGDFLKELRDTYDLQAQQAVKLGAHQVVWGGEYRLWREDFVSTGFYRFAKPWAEIGLGALFVQDEWALAPKFDLTVGLKLEDNNYSGLDWMPNVRLAWRPGSDVLVWGAVSRAVRTPNRTEREQESPGYLAPSPDFSSETLWAYELGYRAKPTARASLSVQAYYNHYDDLRVQDATFIHGVPLRPYVLRNGAEGDTYGIEAWGAYDVAFWWRLKSGFNALHKHFKVDPGHVDLANLQVAGMDPDYQAQLRSEMKLGPRLELDLALRRVGQVNRAALTGIVVPAYTEADARIGWRIGERLELSLDGFNLLNDHHLELDDRQSVAPRAIPRSVFANLRWGF